MSLSKKARKFFGGKDTKKEKSSKDARKAVKKASVTGLNEEAELAELERRLTKMFEGRTELVAGRVQLLKFDNLREKLGDQWERLSDRIQQIIQLAIQRRLTNEDVFIRHGELGYMIVFARLGPEQATLKCALIADEVLKRLLGSEISPEDIEVHTATATVSGNIEMRRSDSIESLLTQLADSLDESSGQHSGVEPGAAGSTYESLSPPEEKTESMYRRTPPFRASDLDYVFQPMWDVSKKVISTFVCIPARRGGAGNFIFGEAAVPDRLEPAQIFDLDSTVLRNAISELLRALDDGRKFLVSVPVHYETLAPAERRQRYFADCRKLSEQDRRFLLFDMIGLPLGAPQSRLMELTVALKPFCRAMIARCSVDETEFAKFKAAGVIAVGFDAAPLALSEADLMRVMEDFVERSEKAGLQTFVHGLNSVSLNTAAIAAGVNYICGQALTSISDQPENVIRFDLNDLFGIPAG